jgi:hypothetical protein
MVSTLSIATDQRSQTPVSRAEVQPSPRKTIPLGISLGDRLTNPAEAACAEAVASWLSGQCDRVVALAELEGLLLYLWSEDDVEGRALDEYLAGDRPLQALLLQARGLSGECDRLAKTELLPFVGRRLEFAVADVVVEKPT